MNYHLHPNSLCEATSIGKGTRIWAFTHILPGAVLGENCNICDHVFIENDVVIGDRVTVKCGVQLWDGLRVENDVFIGPNVTFTNDKFPRSKQYPEAFLQTRICNNASLGANATILPGVTIGENAMIGAGAVVTRSVPANTIVVGNPGRIVGYVDAPLETDDMVLPTSPIKGDNYSQDTSVRNVTFHQFPTVYDLRGNLTFGEFERHIPFKPKRYFMVYDVPNYKIRGEHAHKQCHQFLICIQGSCNVICDDGENRAEFSLDNRSKGLYIPPMVWGIQYKYSADAILLVFASDYYDSDDYIRCYDEFLQVVR